MRRIVFVILAGGFVVGCDGSSSGGAVRDGGVEKTTGTGGAGGIAGGSIFGGAGGGVKSPDGGVVRPPPAINPLSVRVVPGTARLVGSGSNACSNQLVPSGNGDRWCAFFTRGEVISEAELWVFNLTKAVAGTVPKCDGTDPNCLQLTKNLWTDAPDGGPAHPFSHRFDGDTLIFHADAKSKIGDLYKGPVYAWRPGWTKARQISTNAGITCSGHGRAAVAVCLDNLEPDDTKPVTFDLRAGAITDTEATIVPNIDRIFPLRSNDATKWRSGFSRQGDYFAYSTGVTEMDAEALYVMKTVDTPMAAAKKTMIAADAARFAIAVDQQKVYYMKDFNYSVEGDPSGTLVMADFPSGANPVPLQPGIGLFNLLSDTTDVDKGLAFFTEVTVNKGNYRLMLDRTKPTQTIRVADNIAGALPSRDFQFTFLHKNFDDTTGLADAWVVKNDGTSSACALTTKQTADIYGSPFMDGSGLVFWVQNINTTLQVGEGWRAVPADCSGKKQIAKDIDFWFPVKDARLIWSDDTDTDVATLRTAPVTGATFGAGVEIQKQIGRFYALTQPDYDVAVYNIGPVKSEIDGIYLFKMANAGSTPSRDAATTGPADAAPSATDAGTD